MLSWVLRHRHQLRALYGLPPEPALAAFMDLERERTGGAGRPDLDAVPAARPARAGLPQVVLSPRRPQGPRA